MEARTRNQRNLAIAENRSGVYTHLNRLKKKHHKKARLKNVETIVNNFNSDSVKQITFFSYVTATAFSYAEDILHVIGGHLNAVTFEFRRR